jgi:hypothetical protein
VQAINREEDLSMNRKGLVTIGLSLLVGTGLGTTLPGLGVTPARAADVIQRVSTGDRMEAPRWGEQGGEQGEVEAPRAADQTTDGGSGVQAPRWGDQGGEKGETEAPRG